MVPLPDPAPEPVPVPEPEPGPALAPGPAPERLAARFAAARSSSVQLHCHMKPDGVERLLELLPQELHLDA